jgi:SAM-dependent methyltransferase
MLTLVDAHVHVHPCSDVARLLDSALRNFGTEAVLRDAGAWQGVLLLTEMKEADWFGTVRAAPDGVDAGGWRVRPHPTDPLALEATVSGRRLLIVAGRQVVTLEGIEVLTLATLARVPDGLPLGETIKSAMAAGSLVVLPWAVGKWLGRRGRLVDHALLHDPGKPFAGDNGGRPTFWPRPAALVREATRNRPVFGGSDPLPLAGDESRAGSFGFAVRGAFEGDQPALQLREFLKAASARDVSSFGILQEPGRFLRNQVGLRMARKPRASVSAFSADGRETPDVETSSAGYARRFSGKAGRYLLEVQSATIRRALRDLPPGRALDLGGGHGQLVGLLRELGWEVTVHGTEPECERNLRELHGHRDVPFLLGDLFALPVPDRSFDLVISVRLISHVEQWPRLIGEMTRVARQAIVIDYPSTGGLNALGPILFSLKKSLEGNTRTYTSFSRDALVAAFGHGGFRYGRQLKQFLLPMVVHRTGRAAWPLRLAEKLFRAVGLTALLGSPVILRVDRT